MERYLYVRLFCPDFRRYRDALKSFQHSMHFLEASLKPSLEMPLIIQSFWKTLPTMLRPAQGLSRLNPTRRLASAFVEGGEEGDDDEETSVVTVLSLQPSASSSFLGDFGTDLPRTSGVVVFHEGNSRG